jgi:hypothetical protein
MSRHFFASGISQGGHFMHYKPHAAVFAWACLRYNGPKAEVGKVTLKSNGNEA